MGKYIFLSDKVNFNIHHKEHGLNTTSAFFSAMSLLYGLAISVEACIKSREDKVAERYRQTLGMPYN